MFLHHVTLCTGEVCEVPHPDLDLPDRARLRALIGGRAVDGWTAEIFRASTKFIGFRLVYSGRHIVSSSLCLHESISGPLWDRILKFPGIRQPKPVRPTRVPWLASQLQVKNVIDIPNEGAATHMQDAGGLERLVAWELIDGELSKADP